jgi:sugar lactone lactonase YvrE
MVPVFKATLSVDVHDVIGESPLWDAAGERLIWVDNAVGIVREGKQGTQGQWHESRQWALEESVGVAIPRARGGLIVAGGTEIFTISEAGERTQFACIAADRSAVKIGDGKCDPLGRLWFGTQPHDFRRGQCALYRVDLDGKVTMVLDGVGVSNGLDWSPDGRTFYYVDSLSRTVDAFDFQIDAGAIVSRRSIVKLADGDGGFDGLAIDRQGCIWVAVFGKGQLRCYAPDGELLARVEISAPGVTSCAFGGPQGADLFITSASIVVPPAVAALIGWSSESAESSARAPGAGGLFVCRPGVSGNPSTPYAG